MTRALDPHATQQEDKLVLLCALGRLGTCTQEQLLRFVVETQLESQFPFFIALAELKESGLVREVKRLEGELLVLTPEGRQSMELFGGSIRASLQEKLAQHADAWRDRIREELQMPASWEEVGGAFAVTLRALESGQEIFSMKITAATRAQAQRFCERWPARAPGLYQAIMEQLGEEAGEPERDDK